MKLFGTEPATWVTFIVLILKAAITFGLPLTDIQLGALEDALDFGLILAAGFVIRQSVISVKAVDTVQGEGAANAIAAASKAGTTQFVRPASIVLALLFGGSMLLSGCAKLPPGTSPEATFGIRATQVVEGLRAAPPILKTITCTTLDQQKAERRTCVTPNESDFVAAQIQTAFEKAEELGRVLQIYDTTKDAAAQASLMAKAGLIAKAIQEAIGLAQIKPAFEEARQSVLQLFARVSQLLLAFTPVVPAPA